ncbi:hypothetical protein [Hydrogenophaga laconesensis]|uniref:Uncharacterized protein n=1 Tax=Hydrogenophaga laconesensis TaxID=1805971 RepID=A0ABU1V7Z9_9BURK|nr:hypothetical protein [Hydrogenophaga laconesensis]MDR7093485.1 hypothetical protein [Hydrogenophaga laconesensis]
MLNRTHFLRSVVAVGLMALGATAALAQGLTAGALQAERVDNRQDRQEARIEQGVASGELTRRETARLDAREARITRMEHRAEADGKVTGREAVRLERAQDKASRRIALQKHDRQHRPMP